jgi:hypothetical protein
MAQNSNHFFAFTVFTPADVIIYVAGPEAHGSSRIQNMVKTAAAVDTIGGTLFGRTFHTGNPQILLQTCKQSAFLGHNEGIQIHNSFSL